MAKQKPEWEERMDRVERIAERNVVQIEQNSRNIAALQQEMREFKEEMREFKDAMMQYVVKTEQAHVDILKAIEGLKREPA